jgi:hypothetical protein
VSTILVEVTAEDIAEGVPGEADLCPIAIALKRHSSIIYDAWVYDTYVDVDIAAGNDFRLELPASAESFIRRFDTAELRGMAEPFDFCLNIP